MNGSDDSMKLQVGIALAKNSEKYLKFLMWTIDQTALRPERIQYVLGLIGADRDAVERAVERHDAIIVDAQVDGGYGSQNHGECLDKIFSCMTSRYGILMDCDIAFLHIGWDDEMLSRITRSDEGDGRSIIIGAEYDGEKYRGFPNVICAMMDVWEIKGLGVSFKPEGRKTLTGDELTTYGYPIEGGPVSILLDTGSELPRKVKAAGMRGIPLPILRAGSPGARFMKDPMRGEEYQLVGCYPVPVFTHLGRSYTREFGVDPHAILWEQRVREYINANSVRQCQLL